MEEFPQNTHTGTYKAATGEQTFLLSCFTLTINQHMCTSWVSNLPTFHHISPWPHSHCPSPAQLQISLLNSDSEWVKRQLFIFICVTSMALQTGTLFFQKKKKREVAALFDFKKTFPGTRQVKLNTESISSHCTGVWRKQSNKWTLIEDCVVVLQFPNWRMNFHVWFINQKS